MANNKMLIDATHPEETRVVVLRNGRVEEFDYESAARKLLRGNIYLAKVTRVEPSLQAAFVDYGGNRHGFLAFNEIHPDYYQIPMADRQALLEEEAAAEAEEEAAADARAERMARRYSRERPAYEPARDSDLGAGGEPDGEAADDGAEEASETAAAAQPATMAVEAEPADDVIAEELPPPETVGGFEPQEGSDDQEPAEEGEADTEADDPAGEAPVRAAEDGGVQEVATVTGEAESVEQVGSEDALEELAQRPRRRVRSYKIQEVIKRRQVILVQVVKEERGNKGAALTTYLSLAGRYTVLMPNTARGGGISRKITNPQDRKRLKAIAAELEVPEGMGLIIRTAGAARTKQEIKRDFEYLLRLWESVRDLTLQSTAPSLVYEEGNLIKRSIRDLYNKDVEEIIVAGEHAHRDAKDFMRMLMPSHAKNVMLHAEPEPLFTKFGIERQLNAMFSPYVTLRSGGYLVLNQTEALVAIDVNSGKATREFSIEETALNTNLEASDEIARQLKLRDLAGLIVIDFIDMEEKRNNRAVERRLKDALRFDRARIQLGRISHFGLMEMSRQRLRSGVLEGSTSQCPHCQGTGIIRSTESVALAVLRGLEDSLMAGSRTSLVATTTPGVALYILNNKRVFINDMEARYGISIAVQASDKLQGANFLIEKGHAPPLAARRPERAVVNMDWGFEGESTEAAEGEPVAEEAAPVREARGEDEGFEDGGRGRGRVRRRRRGRGGRDRNGGDAIRGREPGVFDGEEADADRDAAAPEPGAIDSADESGEPQERDASEGAESQRHEEGGVRRRRRGRRGGRRGRDRGDRPAGAPWREGDVADATAGEGDQPEPVAPRSSDGPAPAARERDAERPAEPRASRQSAARETETRAPDVREARAVSEEAALVVTEVARRAAADEQPPPRSRARSHATSSEPKLERVVVKPDQPVPVTVPEVGDTSGPARRGWWQRRLSGE